MKSDSTDTRHFPFHVSITFAFMTFTCHLGPNKELVPTLLARTLLSNRSLTQKGKGEVLDLIQCRICHRRKRKMASLNAHHFLDIDEKFPSFCCQWFPLQLNVFLFWTITTIGYVSVCDIQKEQRQDHRTQKHRKRSFRCWWFRALRHRRKHFFFLRKKNDFFFLIILGPHLEFGWKMSKRQNLGREHTE